MAENEVSVYDWMSPEKVNLLRKHIMGDNPHPVAILAANWVAITNYNDVPDWVFALANGNPDMWGDVVEEVRHLIRFDEKKARSYTKRKEEKHHVAGRLVRGDWRDYRHCHRDFRGGSRPVGFAGRSRNLVHCHRRSLG